MLPTTSLTCPHDLPALPGWPCLPRPIPIYTRLPTDPHWQEAAVNTRRPGRDELDRPYSREPENLVLAAGTLRSPSLLPADHPKAQVGHPDDRVSMFWRIFGGTILSIFALVAVTVYNNLQSNVNELRAELSRSN